VGYRWMRRISAVRMVLESAAGGVYWQCCACLKMGQEKKKKNCHVFFEMSFLGVAGPVAVARWQCGVPLDAPDQRGSDGARISGWVSILAMLCLVYR
jgi:hypothetical protein